MLRSGIAIIRRERGHCGDSHCSYFGLIRNDVCLSATSAAMLKIAAAKNANTECVRHVRRNVSATLPQSPSDEQVLQFKAE